MKQLVSFPILAAAAFLGFTASASALSNDVTVAAGGDIAKCGASGDEQTAELVKTLNPTRVVTLGDNVYPDGTIWEFLKCYNPSWGAFKAKTKPSPGNHDYHTPAARGYGEYFSRLDDPWYAWNLRGWRFYSLNSEERIEEQADWLRNDMEGHPRIATSPTGTGPVTAMGSTALLRRWHGGARLTPIHGDRAAVSSDSKHGVLLLTLRTGGYDWSFEALPGAMFDDSQSRSCVNDRAGGRLGPVASPGDGKSHAEKTSGRSRVALREQGETGDEARMSLEHLSRTL